MARSIIIPRAIAIRWLEALVCCLGAALGTLPARAADQPPPQSAREILARYDIVASSFSKLVDGQQLDPDERDLIARVLFRMPRLGLDNIARWRRDDVSWKRLSAAPADHRADFFRLEGRAIAVAQHDLPGDQAAQLEFSLYYAVTLALKDSPSKAIIYTRTIPKAWKVGQPLDERVAADGLFLKLGMDEADGRQLLFAASRIAWLPDRPRPEWGIGPDQVALAERGFDVGLLDEVRKVNRTGLVAVDREAFYQMLAALGPSGRQFRPPAGPLDVPLLLDRPETMHGQILPVEGIARRILKVTVSDADIQQRLGIDHYYEIDLFVPLGEKRIRLGDAAAGAPTYAGSFPATLIVRRLPPELSVGDNIRETVRADAVFFKLWTYPSAYTRPFDQLQVAPLFMADQLRMVRAAPAETWLWNLAAGAAVSLMVAAIAIVFWRYRRSDLACTAERKRKLLGDPPDFSGLS